MIEKSTAPRALKKLFSRKIICTLDDLGPILKTDVRMSIFRRLQTVNYLSSFTHAGRFYTLYSIPKFDPDGIWFFDSVGFSKHGTLKESLTHLINTSQSGHSYKELKSRFKAQLNHPLLELVSANKIKRETFNGKYVYVSKKTRRAAKQMNEYKKRKTALMKQITVLSDWIIVEVLAEAIRGSYIRIDITDICSRLKERNIEVTEDQVKSIFKQYGIKKNRA